MKLLAAIVAALALAAGCTEADKPVVSPTTSPGPGVAQLEVQVVERRPHDATSFTQGLVLDGDTIYESGGLYGKSTLREVDARTGTVRRSISLPSKYFAEGLARVDDRLVLLTWKERVAFSYDLSLVQRAQFGYDTEGWGLCDDGRRLVMSDGTDTLYFRDRRTFAVVGSVRVTRAASPVTELNELECVGDLVYANVWRTDTIVRIDASSGRVTGEIDASALAVVVEDPDDVLNGIAHDPVTDTFLLTGKHWPTLFVVRFVARG